MPVGRKTTERGLGAAHQATRRHLPAPAGEPCPLCRQPMWPGQLLDADHEIPRALGGHARLRWAHRSCNARAGGRLGAASKGFGPARWVDRWA